MVWTAPTPRTTGELITASIWNTDLKDNLLLLKTSIANDGKLDATGGTLRTPEIRNYVESRVGATIVGGVLNLDLTYAEHSITLNQNIASIAFANIPSLGGSPLKLATATLLILGDGVAGRTMNWIVSSPGGSAIRFSGNVPLVPSCTPNGVADIVTMRTYDGLTWLAAVYGQQM